MYINIFQESNSLYIYIYIYIYIPCHQSVQATLGVGSVNFCTVDFGSVFFNSFYRVPCVLPDTLVLRCTLFIFCVKAALLAKRTAACDKAGEKLKVSGGGWSPPPPQARGGSRKGAPRAERLNWAFRLQIEVEAVSGRLIVYELQPTDSSQPSMCTPLSRSAYSHGALSTLGSLRGRVCLPLHHLVSLRRQKAVGKMVAITQPPAEWQRSGCKVVGRRFESWSANCRRWRRRRIHPTGVRTVDQKVYRRLHFHSATAWADVKGHPTAWGRRVCHRRD